LRFQWRCACDGLPCFLRLLVRLCHGIARDHHRGSCLIDLLLGHEALPTERFQTRQGRQGKLELSLRRADAGFGRPGARDLGGDLIGLHLDACRQCLHLRPGLLQA
jgi:hypothetical protein